MLQKANTQFSTVSTQNQTLPVLSGAGRSSAFSPGATQANTGSLTRQPTAKTQLISTPSIPSRLQTVSGTNTCFWPRM